MNTNQPQSDNQRNDHVATGQPDITNSRLPQDSDTSQSGADADVDETSSLPQENQEEQRAGSDADEAKMPSELEEEAEQALDDFDEQRQRKEDEEDTIRHSDR
ncbi:hypothetical protein [Pedobacter sp. SYP-B3415]|uniref:hypothetical protein n=1 Tax=Pedobacter sp. SYP-B3415 TaxID=2496641 RepID=UPI00101B67F2|nr:hypothetical protein [Pedobacter sp. SYP-B3415]